MPDLLRRPPPATPDPPMAPFALAGSSGWAVAGAVVFAAGGPPDWLWTCLAGVLLGLLALPLMIRHDRRREPSGRSWT